MSIKITPALLADLRQKAEAYHLREWFADDILVKGGSKANNEFVAEASHAIDAAYIAAANPAVVLALVEEIERLNNLYDKEVIFLTSMIEHAAQLRKELSKLQNVSALIDKISKDKRNE